MKNVILDLSGQKFVRIGYLLVSHELSADLFPAQKTTAS